MKVFISWSGKPSLHVAKALKKFLPCLIQGIDPWMSDEDISIGSRSIDVLSSELEKFKYGIFCLTRENHNEPWINFEAGAIGKAQGSMVCTYLLNGLKPIDITGPLQHFQSAPGDEPGTKKLLQDLNKCLEKPLLKEVLDTQFQKYWSDLKEELTSMPTPEFPGPQQRDPQELWEEMLELLRTGVVHQRESRRWFINIGRILAQYKLNAPAQSHGDTTGLLLGNPAPPPDPRGT